MSTQYPPRPRMVAPYVHSAVGTLYIAASIFYFLTGSPFVGLIWAIWVPVWLGWNLPSSIRTHRMRIRTWELRCRTLDRVAEFDQHHADLMRALRTWNS